MINRILQLVLVFVMAFFTPFHSVMAQESQSAAVNEPMVVPQNEMQMKLSFAPLVKKVAPAVVNIYVDANTQVTQAFNHPFMNDPLFKMFFDKNMFGGQMFNQMQSSLGSGVIVSEDGLVVTNAHVISGAQEARVVLADGNEYNARVALVDSGSDLALLRIQEKGVALPYVKLKPSESLEVGDLVLAIGNPFGVGQTVTSGIVSAQGSSSLDINDYNFFIQTDAAINPGNSGGPLVDMDGGVVGINTAIYSRGGGSLGIGFAIPSEMVASVIAAEYSGQKGSGGIIRPWLGVKTQDVTPDMAAGLGMKSPAGAIVVEMHSASPLKAAGVKAGDVITSLNGRMIRDASELKFRMATVPIGKVAPLELLRDGKKIELEVTAIVPPEDPPRDQTTLSADHMFKGVVVANLNPALALELGVGLGDEQGVVVVKPSRASYVAMSLRPGDIIVEVNGEKINAPKDVDPALMLYAEMKKPPTLVIKRGGRLNMLYVR